MLEREKGTEEKIIDCITSKENNYILGELINEQHIYKVLENQDKKRHIGILGWLLGETPHTAVHIAGFIAILLTFSGIVVTIFKIENIDYWKTIIPLITSCLGYIFGKNENR